MRFVCAKCKNTTVYIRIEGVVEGGWPKCCKTLMQCPNREEREEFREAIELLLDDDESNGAKQHA